MKLLWNISFLLFGLPFWGQNLIPNGSFEDTISDCYYQRWVDPGTAFFSMAQSWFSPNKGTPDLKAPDGNCPYTGTNFGSTGVNVLATDGNNYAAFYTYDTNDLNSDFREYIGIQLSSSLLPLEYCLEFDIRLMPASLFSTSIGVLMTSDSINMSSNTNIEIEPTIQIGSPYVDTNWTRVKNRFVANGNEEFIYFGNFYNDDNSMISANPGGSYSFSFYCIDNISLILCPDQFDNHLIVYPNPSNGDVIYTQQFSDTTYEVSLYNNLGQIVRYRQFDSGYHEGELFSDLSAGIYILRMQSVTGYREEEKVIVVK